LIIKKRAISTSANGHEVGFQRGRVRPYGWRKRAPQHGVFGIKGQHGIGVVLGKDRGPLLPALPGTLRSLPLSCWVLALRRGAIYLVSSETLGKRPMAWTTPTLVEICIGLEINGYLPAEF
jgi:coenzyme PQQ precursor peptide PqqA